MNTDHMAELRRRIRQMETQTPMPPWKSSAIWAVGGLEAVGYADNSDLLLVVSSNGRGVFDCVTGERVARDYDDTDSWYDREHLLALGIGPLAGQMIRLAGIDGGGLLNGSPDGYALWLVAPTWPDYRVILSPPQASIYEEIDQCVQVEADYEIRAYGFSETGRSFIVAQNHTLYMFSRD
jgi:hypothetical protein